MADRRKRLVVAGEQEQRSMIDLMDLDEIRQVIRDRVASREWYLIPAVSEAANYVMREVEATYYPPDTEANADFEILIGVPHVFALAMARKSRMPYGAMLEIVDPERKSMRFQPAGAPEDNQDIIIALDQGSTGKREAEAAYQFFTWAGVPA